MERLAFREAVLKRDGYACVNCGRNDPPESLDAHHLIERRLWTDGGYHVDNGVTVCPICHMQAETTSLTPEALRGMAGITTILLPPHMPRDAIYDKWGNELVNGQWIPGELFEDESVQKVIKWKLASFRHHRKYPKTPHLPWSPGVAWDDFSVEPSFEGKIVITEKMDGENTTMYGDYIHARSLDMAYHQSRTWIKNLHAKIAHEIPDGWRICGENLFAKHAIPYEGLPSFFLVFSIWDHNTCLSWADTLAYCDVLGLDTVPVLFTGTWDNAMEKELRAWSLDTTNVEGYVVRSAGSFTVRDFQKNMAKWVRPNHVTKDTQNWKAKQVVPNSLV